MSRSVVVACLLLLASCESMGSLELVVPHVDGVTTVRLYFGIGAERTDPIEPESFTFAVSPNRWWPLDKYAANDVVAVADNEEAVFQLTRGDSGQHLLPIVIVVGFGTDGGPIAAARLEYVTIPRESRHIHKIELIPLPHPDIAVHTWPRDQDTCVAYRKFDDERGTTMVVDANDPDCDAVATECVDTSFMGALPAELDEVFCLAPESVITQAPSTKTTCVLGGPNCQDGPGPQLSCEETGYCVPASVCEACTSATTPILSFGCASDLWRRFVDEDSMPSHAFCLTGRDPDPQNNGRWCGDEQTVSLNLPLAGAKCTDMKITRGVLGDWGSSVQVDNLGAPLTIDLKRWDPLTCDFTLRASGGSQNVAQAGLLVAGRLDNGRGFAYPVVFSAEGSVACGTLTTCDVRTRLEPDLMSECIHTPAPDN